MVRIVFAGVGIGIVFAGLVGLAAGLDAWGSRSAWIVMGVVAAALAFFLWWPLTTNAVRTDAVASKIRGVPRRAFVAAACYGLFGYGYIIPATFLPALARGYIDDPAVFGWVWPVFGIAAGISTLSRHGSVIVWHRGVYGQGLSGYWRPAYWPPWFRSTL